MSLQVKLYVSWMKLQEPWNVAFKNLLNKVNINNK